MILWTRSLSLDIYHCTPIGWSCFRRSILNVDLALFLHRLSSMSSCVPKNVSKIWSNISSCVCSNRNLPHMLFGHLTIYISMKAVPNNFQHQQDIFEANRYCQAVIFIFRWLTTKKYTWRSQDPFVLLRSVEEF